MYTWWTHLHITSMAGVGPAPFFHEAGIPCVYVFGNGQVWGNLWHSEDRSQLPLSLPPSPHNILPSLIGTACLPHSALAHPLPYSQIAFFLSLQNPSILLLKTVPELSAGRNPSQLSIFCLSLCLCPFPPNALLPVSAPLVDHKLLQD